MGLGTAGAIFVFLILCVSSTDVSSRLDCFPDPGATESACRNRGCLWQPVDIASSPVGTPWCFFPSGTGYKLDSDDGQGNLLISKAKGAGNPFGFDISQLNVKVRSSGSTVLVSIGTKDRYVPPVEFPEDPSYSTDTIRYQTTTGDNGIFSFKVVRGSNGEALWDTSIGGLLFADKFIQIATFLPSANIFGFGDHVHKKLKHDMSRYTTWSMFARDIAPDSGSSLSTTNLYGVHPFYICVEGDGKAHGVFILNSNAQEVALGPAPHLIYRTIGGQLDIAFFPGPTPEMVVQQYLAHIGTPFLPAYWALGFQLCRWGYRDLDELKSIIARVQAAGVPLDVPYADIDYMSHDEDFTEGDKWVGFSKYADQLHQNGLHVILIFDPAVEVDYASFQRAVDQNASFIEWQTFAQVPHNVQDQYPLAKNTKIMLGNVWPERNTAFPDFLDPTDKTTNWWIEEFVRFHNVTAFDGIWIDMNEPSNFDTDVYSSNDVLGRGIRPATSKLACPVSGPDGTWDNPPYWTHAVYDKTNEHLCSKTLCMLGTTARGSNVFYNTKNLYGWSEARATAKALRTATGKRGAVISRSTFPSSGRFGGHWLGDNTARWEDLQTSVIGAMEFNWFGLPYVGSDICGFNGETNEELCLRWHQMGAFHSFSRNHNSIGMSPQDPAQWPSVAKAAKMALTFRYQYLPYLYTLHYNSSLYGTTVIRPLFFEFPNDFETMNIDRQFMWGNSLMIAPALEAGMTSVHAYFPADTWYSLNPQTYGQKMPVGFNMVPAKLDSLTPVFARGGVVVPRQTPSTTTTASRKNPFELLITCSPRNESRGELFYDDGVTAFDSILKNDHFHFKFHFYTDDTHGLLTIISDSLMDYTLPSLEILDIIGYNFYPDFTSFTFNGKKMNVNTQTSSFNAFKQQLYISTPNLIDMNAVVATDVNNIMWNHRPL